MSGYGPEASPYERRRSLLLWALGLGLCLGGVVLFFVLATREDAHSYLQKFAGEVRTCEPQVRRITMAYLPSIEDGFSNAQRQAARTQISGFLAPVRPRLEVVDRGLVPRLDCAILPKSPQDLTVLLFERDSILSLATIHYRPGSDICRSIEPDASGLEVIRIRQHARYGTHDLNSDLLQTWAENLPRVANPDCRQGHRLPGANNVNPRNQRTVQ